MAEADPTVRPSRNWADEDDEAEDEDVEIGGPTPARFVMPKTEQE